MLKYPLRKKEAREDPPEIAVMVDLLAEVDQDEADLLDMEDLLVEVAVAGQERVVVEDRPTA